MLSFGSAFNQVELSPQTESSTCPKILTLVPNPVASKRASAVNTDQTFHRSLNSAPVTPGERREQGLQLQLLLLKSFDMWGKGRGGERGRGGGLNLHLGRYAGRGGGCSRMQNHHLSDKAGEKQDGAFLAFEFRGRRNAF